MASRRVKAAAAAFVGVCLIISAVELISSPTPTEVASQYRRFLQEEQQSSSDDADAEPRGSRPPVNPVLQQHIKPLSREPDPDRETVLFYHIPKSGGTTLKSIYKCMDLALAVRVGVEPRFGHDKDEELVVFSPGATGANFVNVDTLTRKGILRAEKMGLVPSGVADLIVTSSLNFAVEHLYDPMHKGRVLSLFRDPAERLISKFYYSQVA